MLIHGCFCNPNIFFSSTSQYHTLKVQFADLSTKSKLGHCVCFKARKPIGKTVTNDHFLACHLMVRENKTFWTS